MRDEGIWDSEQERGCQEGYSQVEDDLVNREGSLLGNGLQGALSTAGELNRLVGGRAVFLCKADLFKFFRTEQALGKLALLLKSLVKGHCLSMESGATLSLPVPVPCHRTRDNPGRGWREDTTTTVGKELWGFWSELLLPQELQLESERGSSKPPAGAPDSFPQLPGTASHFPGQSRFAAQDLLSRK